MTFVNIIKYILILYITKYLFIIDARSLRVMSVFLTKIGEANADNCSGVRTSRADAHTRNKKFGPSSAGARAHVISLSIWVLEDFSRLLPGSNFNQRSRVGPSTQYTYGSVCDAAFNI